MRSAGVWAWGLVGLLTAVPVWAQAEAPDAERAAPARVQPGTMPEDRRDRVFWSSETERPKALAAKLAKNVWMDMGGIATSPFRMNREQAPYWIGFTAATGAFIAFDRHLSTQLPNSKDQVAISTDISRLGAVYTILPVTAGFYLYGWLAKDAKARETSALGTEALVDSLITVSVLKVIFSRERPDEGSGHGHFFNLGHDGFPSGHSIMGWALASVVSHEYANTKWVPIVAYSLSGLVSASRFTGRKHFASDLLAGGAGGWFIGRYVFQTHVNHRIHQRRPDELSKPLSRWIPRVAPGFAPQAGGAMTVGLEWNLARRPPGSD